MVMANGLYSIKYIMLRDVNLRDDFTIGEFNMIIR